MRLRLVIGYQLFKGFNIPLVEDSPLQINPVVSDYVSHIALSKMLRATLSEEIPNVHSSDNGLLAAHVYGRNIKEYDDNLKHLLACLMLDTLVDHERFAAQRSAVFLKNYFYANGVFLDSKSSIKNFREIAIKLTEGYELRRMYPDLGFNTHQNLITTHQVLVDLNEFFTEIYNGNRNNYVSGAGSNI